MGHPKFKSIISSSQYLLCEDKSVKRRDSSRFKKIYSAETNHIIRADNNLPEYKAMPPTVVGCLKLSMGK